MTIRRTSFADRTCPGMTANQTFKKTIRTTAKVARPVVIGLCGGVASGKSAVASLFAQLGAAVLNADAIGHEVLEQDDVKQLIRQRWGGAPFENNLVNRQRLANIVFNPTDGPQHLAKLEQITHPRIKQRIAERLAEFTETGSVAVVLDAPLLLEAGWDVLCDKLVFVQCDRSMRLERALNRNWTESEFDLREKQQLPVGEKQSRCHAVVENSGDMNETRRQVETLWNDWHLNVSGPNNNDNN